MGISSVRDIQSFYFMVKRDKKIGKNKRKKKIWRTKINLFTTPTLSTKAQGPKTISAAVQCFSHRDQSLSRICCSPVDRRMKLRPRQRQTFSGFTKAEVSFHSFFWCLCSHFVRGNPITKNLSKHVVTVFWWTVSCFFLQFLLDFTGVPVLVCFVCVRAREWVCFEVTWKREYLIVELFWCFLITMWNLEKINDELLFQLLETK